MDGLVPNLPSFVPGMAYRCAQDFRASGDPGLPTFGHEYLIWGSAEGGPRWAGTICTSRSPCRQECNEHHWALTIQPQCDEQSQGEALPPGQPRQQLNMKLGLPNVDKWAMEFLEAFVLPVTKEHGTKVPPICVERRENRKAERLWDLYIPIYLGFLPVGNWCVLSIVIALMTCGSSVN